MKKETADKVYKIYKIILASISIVIIIFILIIIIWDPFNNKWGDLGQGYTLDYDPLNNLAIYKDATIYAIHGVIVDYDYDSTFIIASQKLPDNRYIYSDSIEYYLKDTDYKKYDLKKYWIINKKLDSIYGPFTRATFKKERKIKGVSDSLKLKKEGGI